ncbi:MAG: PIN domain-containing protein [Puniceicoccaceae bacterium]|nr:MAG: PIN domain-containing protein [Puniceicoccaceae bacterium]
MRALLDINVLIALFDADHIFNDRAHSWLEAQSSAGIASCPLVENGLIRILSNPNYSKKIRLTPPDIIRRLDGFIARQDHCLIEDSISLTNQGLFDLQHILGSKQITDIYLLALAAKHGLKLATFDANINLKAVKNATAANLEIL